MADPEILATLIDNQFVRITPPAEHDGEVVVEAKAFLLACLTRRNADPDFGMEMQQYIEDLSSADLRRINRSPMRQ